MSVETAEELAALREAGRVVAEALRSMRRAVEPGVTTSELDAVAGRVFRRAGARSGPRLDYGFPGPRASASTRRLSTVFLVAVAVAVAVACARATWSSSTSRPS